MSGHGTEYHDPHLKAPERPPVAAHGHHEGPVEVPKPGAAHDLVNSLDFGDPEEPHEGEPSVEEFSSALALALKNAHVADGPLHAVVETLNHEATFAKAVAAASHKLAELDAHFDVDAFCKEKGFYKDAGPVHTVDVAPKKPENVQQVVTQTRAAIYRGTLSAACLSKLGPEKARRLKMDNLIGDESEEQKAYNLAMLWLKEVFLHDMDRSAISRAGSEAARKKHTQCLDAEAEVQAHKYLEHCGAALVTA